MSRGLAAEGAAASMSVRVRIADHGAVPSGARSHPNDTARWRKAVFPHPQAAMNQITRPTDRTQRFRWPDVLCCTGEDSRQQFLLFAAKRSEDETEGETAISGQALLLEVGISDWR